MPAKRKHKKSNACASTDTPTERKQTKTKVGPTLLDLPLEVRQFIYELCYLDPHPLSSRDLFDLPFTRAMSGHKGKKRRPNQPLTEPAVQKQIITKCKLPQSHLSLESVCRQIRNEYFPVFARHHAFSFTESLSFANDYLSYNPPHRYSNIRHLAVCWRAPLPKCKCEIGYESACTFHPVRHAQVFRDVRSLVKMVDTYPELFNSLESIRMRLEGTKRDGALFDTIKFMFKHAALFVEKMDRSRRRNVPNLSEQKYILAVSEGYVAEAGIFLVTDSIWDLLVDGSALRREYDASGRMCLMPTNWTHLDEFSRAIEDGKFFRDRFSSGIIKPTTDDDNVEEADSAARPFAETRQTCESNYKVVFGSAIVPRTWLAARHELDGWKHRSLGPDILGHPEYYALG